MLDNLKDSLKCGFLFTGFVWLTLASPVHYFVFIQQGLNPLSFEAIFYLTLTLMGLYSIFFILKEGSKNE